jgi:hypothetical protein
MKCKKCIVAFHIGHSTYTKEEYEDSKKRDDLDCCGGTILLNYCPICGKKLKEMEDRE